MNGRSLRRHVRSAGWMLCKSSMSVDDCKAFRKELFIICHQVKHKPSSIKASPSIQKGSSREVLLSDKDHQRLYKELCDMEMPLVDNGNMKHFHKAFISYFPRLLMLKEKYGHLQIPGDDPKKEFQQWLKNIRATMSKYDHDGSL
jgi:adenine-specific DNA methylase